ncbi:MAG TPA: putative quinol monooxygenase [Armatimonadota bacterium]|nr:putative quinol monooxygenase [Armatimonadota bacterium]HQK95987.1 putative quinol monooxygenase [Armatimonadota bacterium]
MVKLVAVLKAKPGQEAAVTQALRDLAVPSKAEPGCVMYVPCRSKADPAKLVVIEEWADQAAFDAHAASPHFQAFLAKVGNALAGEPELEFVEVL